ncbi:MAG: nucleotidyltransferase family protein, partial [Verrucomicrobiota bacterium]
MTLFHDESLPPEEEATILLSLSRISAGELEHTRKVVEAVQSWERVFELAEINATEPLLLANLKQHGWNKKLPPDVANQFEAVAQRIEEANRKRLDVVQVLLRKMHERDVPTVILKGILFGETIYHNPYYKKMNDLDILIRFDDLDTIYEIYRDLKFFSAAEILGGKEKDPRKQEKFSHHAPPFFSRDLHCMIGTHWGLITPLAPYKVDYAAIWSRVVDIECASVPAKSMAPEDNLHHLCIHLPYYKAGIRELADIYNLIRTYRDELDWDLLLT